MADRLAEVDGVPAAGPADPDAIQAQDLATEQASGQEGAIPRLVTSELSRSGRTMCQ